MSEAVLVWVRRRGLAHQLAARVERLQMDLLLAGVALAPCKRAARSVPGNVGADGVTGGARDAAGARIDIARQIRLPPYQEIDLGVAVAPVEPGERHVAGMPRNIRILRVVTVVAAQLHLRL